MSSGKAGIPGSVVGAVSGGTGTVGGPVWPGSLWLSSILVWRGGSGLPAWIVPLRVNWSVWGLTSSWLSGCPELASAASLKAMGGLNSETVGFHMWLSQCI